MHPFSAWSQIVFSLFLSVPINQSLLISSISFGWAGGWSRVRDGQRGSAMAVKDVSDGGLAGSWTRWHRQETGGDTGDGLTQSWLQSPIAKMLLLNQLNLNSQSFQSQKRESPILRFFENDLDFLNQKCKHLMCLLFLLFHIKTFTMDLSLRWELKNTNKTN